jgi:thiamine pyrophosphate-dependent acetolactate synthase large subunit-like protein
MEIPNEMTRYGQMFGTSMGAVRWDIVAQGLGCHGEFVQAITELPAALQRSRGQERSSVICVRTSVQPGGAAGHRGPVFRSVLWPLGVRFHAAEKY